MGKYCVGTLITLLALAGHAAPQVNQNALRAAMSDSLKDSESARFKDIKLKQDGDIWLICGQVNSKNSFGAYPGFSPFFVMGVSGTPGRPISTFIGPTLGEVAEIRCAQDGIGQ